MRIYFRRKVSGSKQWTKATVRGTYNAHSKIVEWNVKSDFFFFFFWESKIRLIMRYLNWMRFISVNLYSCTLKKKWNRTIINLMMRILCGYYGRPTWIRYIKTKRNMIILITQQWHQWSEHRLKQSKRISKSNPMDACLWCKNVWTQDQKLFV